MTLGSLFDGAGTMPFAAQLCGIKTEWSSEIEKFPKEVTAKRFPNVKQLGDITKINGGEIKPVDIIAGGSPCQDLSVAGKRERELVCIAIDRAAFNQGENAKYDIGIDKTGIAQTVVAKGPGAVCYKEKPVHYLMRVRQGKEGGGKGPLVQENMSGTIACGDDQILFEQEKSFYVVRRLTPLECCRLQGMPDWWCKDVPHSDAQEYKMWGNGMALPNALYIMEGF